MSEKLMELVKWPKDSKGCEVAYILEELKTLGIEMDCMTAAGVCCATKKSAHAVQRRLDAFDWDRVHEAQDSWFLYGYSTRRHLTVLSACAKHVSKDIFIDALAKAIATSKVTPKELRRGRAYLASIHAA